MSICDRFKKNANDAVGSVPARKHSENQIRKSVGMKKGIPITAMVLTMLLGLFGCSGTSGKTITSVETMSLTQRGMRGGQVYKFEIEGDVTHLRRYREVYSAGEDELVLEVGVPCDSKTMVELMNTCMVFSWDGFHGKHPKNVQDGIMFIFKATVNDGQTIQADGSANFPKGYREFVQALDAMLAESENS